MDTKKVKEFFLNYSDKISLEEESENGMDFRFYHSVLQCRIFVSIENKPIGQTDSGSLSEALENYKKLEQKEEENPPVGILMIADGDQTMVQFNTAGMDPKLFVHAYLHSLPKRVELESLKI